jgi:exonuclease VII small subunit
MSWHGIFRELREWSETLWPEDRAAREQAKRDRLYRLLRQCFEGLVRRRQRIETLRENAATEDLRLKRHEDDYRQRLSELEQIKKQLARIG